MKKPTVPAIRKAVAEWLSWHLIRGRSRNGLREAVVSYPAWWNRFRPRLPELLWKQVSQKSIVAVLHHRNNDLSFVFESSLGANEHLLKDFNEEVLAKFRVKMIRLDNDTVALVRK